MNKNYKVVGIGELLWDCLPTGKQLGGAPCNFAYHAFQAGCEAHVVSAIGCDNLGEEILSLFETLHLNKTYVQQTADYPTGTVTVTVDENGIPHYVINENVAWDNVEWNSDLGLLAQSVDAVCFGSLAQRNVVSREAIQQFLTATKPDCLRVFDINLRQAFYKKEIIEKSLEYANVFKLNDDELPVVAKMFGLQGSDEELLEHLISKFKLEMIALTKGNKGSLLLNNKNEKSFIEVPKVKVADTVGAGDSFTAILIAGLLHDFDLKSVHQKATEVAAFVCTQAGATPEIPMSILHF